MILRVGTYFTTTPMENRKPTSDKLHLWPADLQQNGAMKPGFNPDCAILALQRAIEATFDESRWCELGYNSGKIAVIRDHTRLLRSLAWNDNDYGACIFRVLPQLLGETSSISILPQIL
jgi:hypothetical protein